MNAPDRGAVEERSHAERGNEEKEERVMRIRILLAILLGPAAPAIADDWPQYLGPKRDGVWRETGVLDKFPAGGPTVLWKKPLGAGFSGPAVVAGKVFLTDYKVGDGQKAAETGFGSPTVVGTERVLCLD